MTLPSPAPWKSELLAKARAIAGRIRQEAVPGRGGSVTWLAAGVSPDAPPVPLGPHVYAGTTGIALFLAACDHVSGLGEHREFVLSILAPLRLKLRELAADAQRAAALRLGVGGLIGLGSYLYSFLLTGTWLGDSELLSEAHALSALFTPERVAQDDFLDVVLGSAGAALALLSLPGRLPDRAAGASPLVAAAEVCGDHLLRRRVSFEGRPQAWPPLPDRPPSTGFSHGAAGICYALLRLYQASGREPYLAAALEGLAFERSLYSSERGNWQDTRVKEPRYLTMWCHGAPGILLGRVAALDVLDDAQIRQDIAAALATTRAVAFTDVDHLCCGNLGRADILLQVSRSLGEPALELEGRDLALRAVERAGEELRFGLPSSLAGGLPDPTLFKGLAGIGYALLRFADPTLPCCLCLEAPA